MRWYNLASTLVARSICALALVLWLPTANAIDYAVTVSRDAQDIYVGKVGFQGVIKTQFCFEFVFFDNATLRLTTFSTGILIFSSGRQCSVLNVFDPATVAAGNYAVFVNSACDGYYELTDSSFLIKAWGVDAVVGSPATLVLTSAVAGLAFGTITVANGFSLPVQLSNIYVSRQGALSSANYQGLWWRAPAGTESGWGINFAHQGDSVFATWYTYDTAGKGWWLSMLATRTTPTSNAYAGAIYVNSGPPFNNYVGAGTPAQVGTGTLTFGDANNGSFSYMVSIGGAVVSQTKAITRFDLGTGPQVTCVYGAASSLPAATNYQDLWWVAGGTQSGWGINFAHQGNTIYATWYTYDLDGTPLWLSALMQRVGATSSYTGSLLRTSGPRFDNYHTTDLKQNQTVGSATLTFADGNNATFSYTVQLSGMAGSVTQSKQITRFLFSATAGTVCH